MEKIKICKNGPYLVTDVPLNQENLESDKDGHLIRGKTGKKITDQKEYSLCRCGQSKNMPFCDGSHRDCQFDGTENPQAKQKFEDVVDQIDGPDLILKDAVDLCVGIGYCHREGGVWYQTENSQDPELKKTAIEICGDCPSGRLVAVDKKTGKPIEPKLAKSIDVAEYGPLCVKGGVSIESVDGTTYENRNRVTLCRCGKSRNKPFCDGSHQD
ncbi:MAG: CDGSH iron-sulfur domain-containing protein [Candidatus Shapirobacteria bacterium]|nr:CDGSH iron-sulfur domain-containing protein [Candidatus Shapirobacteria bacterium]